MQIQRRGCPLESRDANSVLNFYKQMIKFRREHEELILGDYSELALPDDLNEKLFAFTRDLNNSKLAVIINFSLEKASLPEGLDNCEPISNNLNNSSNVLQPLEARIYKLK